MKNCILILLILITGCSRENINSEIKYRLGSYGKFIETMQPDSLAQFYLPQGSLSGQGESPIVGPKAIAKHLKQFIDFTVLEYRFTTDSIYTRGDTVLSNGSYFQKVIVPTKDTLALGGKIICKWMFDNQQWKIQSMFTYDYRDLKQRSR